MPSGVQALVLKRCAGRAAQPSLLTESRTMNVDSRFGEEIIEIV